ncbi:hypothetical protein HDV01_005418 [Terramyces sp. JEL0728]|nr:hypothetical protein HDV01_005418 [Terramyces sp. JEL0728]
MPWEIIEAEECLTSTFKFKEMNKSSTSAIVGYRDIVITSEKEIKDEQLNLQLKEKDLIKDGNVIAQDVVKFYSNGETVVCYSNGDLEILGKKRVPKFCELPIHNLYFVEDQIIVVYSEPEVGGEGQLYCVDIKNEKIYQPFDPASAFSSDIPNSYFFAHLSSSTELQHIVVVANKASTDIGTLCYKDNVWFNLTLDDGATIVMPMLGESDSYPAQMYVDYTLNQVDGATPDSPKIKCCKLFVLNDQKDLLEFCCVWNGLKDDDILIKRLKSEKEAEDLRREYANGGQETISNSNEPLGIKSPKTTPAFGAAGFGNVSFGQTGFGTNANTPGQLKATQAAKGFGNYSNTAVSFGNVGSAFGSAESKPIGAPDAKIALAGGKPGLFGTASTVKEEPKLKTDENQGKTAFTFGNPTKKSEIEQPGFSLPKPAQTPAADVKKEPGTDKVYTFGKSAEKSEADPFGLKSPKQTQNVPQFGADVKVAPPAFTFGSAVPKKETPNPATFTFGTPEKKKEEPFGLKSPKLSQNTPAFGSAEIKQPLFGNLTKTVQPPMFGKVEQKIVPPASSAPAKSEESKSTATLEKKTIPSKSAKPKDGKKSARQILVDQFDKTYVNLEKDIETLNSFQKEATIEIDTLLENNTTDIHKRDHDVSTLHSEISKVSLITRSLLDKEQFKNQLEILKSKKKECEHRLNMINSNTKKTELSRKISPEAELLQQKITMKNEDVQAKLELAEHKINVARIEIEKKQVRVQPNLQSIYNTSKQLRRTISTLKSQLLEHQQTINTFIPKVKKDSTPVAPAPPKLKTKKSSYGLDEETMEADNSILKPPVTLNIDAKETLLKKEKIRNALMQILSENKIAVTEASAKSSATTRTHKTIAEYRREIEIQNSSIANEDGYSEEEIENQDYEESDEGDDEEYERFLERDTTPKRKSSSPHGKPEEYVAGGATETLAGNTQEKVPFNFQNSTPPNVFSFSNPEKLEKNSQPIPFSFSAAKQSGWTCDSCLVPNKAGTIKCVACETAKVGKEPAVTTGFSFNLPKTGDWTCDSCLVKNKPDDTKCVSCETVKPGSKTVSKPENKSVGGAFVMPGAPPPPVFSFNAKPENKSDIKPQPSAFVLPGGGAAPTFSFQLPTKDIKDDAKPQPGAFVMPTAFPSSGYIFGAQVSKETDTKSALKLPGWTCESCLVPNKGEALKCAACETAKPSVKSESKNQSNPAAPPLTLPSSKPSGWTCDSCLVPNTAEAVKCVACETARPGSKAQAKTESNTDSKAVTGAFVMPGLSPPSFSFAASNTTAKSSLKPQSGAFVMPGTASGFSENTKKDTVPAEGITIEKKVDGPNTAKNSVGTTNNEPTVDSEKDSVSTRDSNHATEGTPESENERISETTNEIGDDKLVTAEAVQDSESEQAGDEDQQPEEDSVEREDNDKVDDVATDVEQEGQSEHDDTVENIPQGETEPESVQNEVSQEDANENGSNKDLQDESAAVAEDVQVDEPTVEETIEQDQDDGDKMENDEAAQDNSQVPSTGFGSFGFDSKPKNKVNPMFGNVEPAKDVSTSGFASQNTFGSFGSQNKPGIFGNNSNGNQSTAFGNTTNSTFGSTGFGNNSTTSAFGGNNSTSAFGNSTTTPGNTANAFGNNTLPAFGQSAFTTPTKNTSAFGTPANQPSAFGTPGQTSAFGAPGNQSSAFGNPTNQPSAFGTPTNQTSAFGGQQSAFGTTSNQNSAFGNSNGTSFGQTGFGTANSNPTFGQSGFSSPANANPGFGQTGFGTPNAGNAAFGQTGFGNPSFGSTGFGSAKPTGFANVTPTRYAFANYSFSGSAFSGHAQPVGFASVPQTNTTGTFGGGGTFGGNSTFGRYYSTNISSEKKSSFTGYRG